MVLFRVSNMMPPEMFHPHPSPLSVRRRRQAVTLTELLVVIAIISMLAGATMPAISNLMHGQDMTRNLFAIQGALQEARSMAMAQNTFVWLGVSEKQIDGQPALVLSAVSSRSGQASDLKSGNTRPLMKPVILRNIALDEAGYRKLPGVDVDNSTLIEKSDLTFSLKLPGNSAETVFNAIEFKPSGEVGLCSGALRYIGIGLAGGPSEAARQAAGIQLSRLSGHAVVFRQ